ncbi:Mba1p Ecym_7055 [Eremothecium cymbalariae DBVPG|uniref:MBA1-like protein n=1 Tax=Eremothecium cymbalariae (strain CBS 270.75 / DBVPG 7215 / KCTC 17166 / NRRL Y-17582) TaxID=931890 RepID=G8JVP3_ERECY|nr:hypothetical protein Ecym_7055 [Eremothecium cymbalariae DBVPG\
MLCLRFTRGPVVGIQNRFFSSSRVLQKANEDGHLKPAPFNPRHLGVANEVYIPPSYQNLPSVFSSPLVVTRALIRRMYTFGLNTVQVALFRYQSGIKPKFLLWKNKAIESYVNVNKGFASKNIDSVAPTVSIWVEEALRVRARQLPKGTQFEWELIKFNEIPKLASTQALMIPGRPLEMIQLIYKFNTKQRLIRLDKSTGKADKVHRDLVDYVAFLCDASTNDIYLIGSVFESAPEAKLPAAMDTDTKALIETMKINGDIYREQPTAKKGT